MKKIVCVIVAIILTVPLSLIASAQNAYNDPYGFKAIAFSEKANEEYNKLIEQWGNNCPDYYAGAYIENMTLFILVTCTPETVSDEISNIIKEINVKIIKAKYSINHLENIRKRLELTIKSLDYNTRKAFVGFGIDEKKNSIELEVLEKYIADEKYVDSVIGHYPEIYYTFKNEEYHKNTDINAGDKDWIENGTDYSISTISCMGSRINSSGNVENGIVISGHSGNVGDVMKINGTSVGTVVRKSYGGNLDAAFVKISSSTSYSLSQKLSSNYKITTYGNVGIVGSIYTMHGMASGMVAGFVNNTSFSFIMDDINFNDMIRMRLKSAEGDSGGPLVVATHFLSKNNKIIGFLSGGDNTYSNFTKYTVFASAYSFNLL